MGKVKESKTGRKGGPLSKVKRNKIKQEIIAIIDDGRFSSFNKLGYSRDKNINRATLQKILEEIGSEITQENKEVIKIDILRLYERLKKRILYWWDKCENASEEDESFFLEKQVMRELRETIKDFRQTCIELGIIDKVADHINFSGVILNANVDIKQVSSEILGEIRRDK